MHRQASAAELLTPILRACLLSENEAQTSTPGAEAAPLAEWVRKNLAESAQRYHISNELVLDRLRDAAKELTAQINEPFQAELVSSYNYLRFVEHVLCEPPTVPRVIAHRFDVDTSVIDDWCNDVEAIPGLARVVAVLLDRLVDLCKDPERPLSDLPDGSLERFDHLTYLDGLRYVFEALYKTNEPKIAQSIYLPPLLKHFDEFFRGDRVRNGVLVAPTNGGKNGIILTMAMAAVAWDSGPTVVLQPFRAQIAESVRTWTNSVSGRPVYRRKLETVKTVRVAGSSALISDFDPLIVRGRVDISAIIPEKLAVLSRQRALESFCKLLVADEIGLLFDPERGGKLEIILTLARVSGISIFAAGAAVSEQASERLALWLSGNDATRAGDKNPSLFHDPSLKRDPPIEILVWRRDGQLRFWREGMTPLDPNKASTDPLADQEDDAICELITRELTDYPERQILVFLNNRQRVVDLAEDLSSRIRASNSLSEKLDAESNDSPDDISLSEVWLGGALPFPADVPGILEQRVGVHTRDVPSNNLERIEEAFRSGRLRVLFATTTVEAGINLPVDTVVQVGLEDHDRRRLSQRALEQRLGRSGRTIAGAERQGRGIVYVHNANQGIERIIHERILLQDGYCKSQLGQPERALLLLFYLSNAQDRSKKRLREVLASSYWALGRRPDEISNSTNQAINDLRQHRLAEPDTLEGEADGEVWAITPIGRAMASALLLPDDSSFIEGIVKVARSTSAGASWLPEVIFAACCVPSFARGKNRPRIQNVVARRPRTPSDVLRAWTAAHESGIYSFALPRRKSRMVGGPEISLTLKRIEKGTAKTEEKTALLRAYIAWLWSQGEDIKSTRPYIKHLNEHVVRQDLGYYLSHILRAAAWLAQFEGDWILSQRLSEISREVDLGVPTHLVSFYETCIEHIPRSQVVGSGVPALDSLLDDLDPGVSADLRGRLAKKREDKLDLLKELALEVGVAETAQELVCFERLDSADKLSDILSREWHRDFGPHTLIDESRLLCGNQIVKFVYGQNPLRFSDCDILISGSPLEADFREDRSYQGFSILGPEELIALVIALHDREAVAQQLLLAIVAEVGGVVQIELIQAVEALIDSKLPSQIVLSEDVALAREQLLRYRSGWIPSPQRVTERDVAAHGKGDPFADARERFEQAATLLESLVEDEINARTVAMRGAGEVPEIEVNLHVWRSNRRKVRNIRQRGSSSIAVDDLVALCKELNDWGDTWFPAGVWETVETLS